MPQGRRKVPFSNKKKKQQLQEKRERKKEQVGDSDEPHRSRSDPHFDKTELVDDSSSLPSSSKLFSVKPQLGREKDVERYRLEFMKESREKLQERRRLAHRPLEPLRDDDLEIGCDEVFLPGSELDVPKRPKWDYSLSREQLEAKEQRYFREYLYNIEKKFNLEDLSYFELNLETWRQLWRVLEMSDILLFILDIRYPSLLFSPAAYQYVKDLKKEAILVINKIDLAPPALVAAWKFYFEEKFPGLRVICFTSFPDGTKTTFTGKRRPQIQQKMAADSAKRLLEICKEIVGDEVDLSSWMRKIEEELHSDSTEVEHPEVVLPKESVDEVEEHTPYKNGILTIGCIGFPNVGKSSVLNGLKGKKVVSVSRTPGHTKHFQTIFLTPTVKLCDCPGLVFPSKVPKALQVLAGSYPISQVQEPYSAIRFLAERIPLVDLLRIKHPEDDKTAWTPYDICDAWAEKRGFVTAKAARNDTYRAGNNILRMALDGGKVVLCLRPPGYNRNKDFWNSHEYVKEISQLVNKVKDIGDTEKHPVEEFSESEEDEVEPNQLSGSATGDCQSESEGSDSDDTDDVDENVKSVHVKPAVGTINKFAVLGDS